MRSRLITDDVTVIRGVVGVFFDPDHDPDKVDHEACQLLRRYDQGQYDVIYNKLQQRWQILAQYRNTLRLVKTWQDAEGRFLPFSRKCYEWLVATSHERQFGTRKASEIDRIVRNAEADSAAKHEASIQDDLKHFKRDNRHVFNRIHARWQKNGYDLRELYPNAGKKVSR